MNYKLFVVNFHGSGLNAIRNEFKERVQSGQRRYTFLIDIDEEMRGIHYNYEDLGKMSKLDRTSHHLDRAHVTRLAIEKCIHRFEGITHLLHEIDQFDYLEYWYKNLPEPPPTPIQTAKTKVGTAKPLPSAAGTGKKQLSTMRSEVAKPYVCPDIEPLYHHKIGGRLIPKPIFIRDEPPNSKLFIIIIGTFDNAYYKELLSHGEPLLGIVNFIPLESMFDRLLPHSDYYATVLRGLWRIKNDICALRRSFYAKPTGIFRHGLPVISKCLAKRYSDEIFDELSWYFYDLEYLYKNYQRYYMDAFHMTNVSMSPAVKMRQLFETLPSLSMQGSFLKNEMPGIGTDISTLTVYLGGMLGLFGPPEHVLSEPETILLSIVGSHLLLPQTTASVLSMTRDYHSAFNSITKIKKYDRLFVDESNRLLYHLISYADQELFHKIYCCCLEYKFLRKHVTSGCVRNAYKVTPAQDGAETIFLPHYAKFLANTDTVLQRLEKLMIEYDHYTCEEYPAGHKVYIFRRDHNEIIEREKTIIIPTRLCFRDFTIYHLDEFNDALVTPEDRHSALLNRMNEVEREHFLEGKGSVMSFDHVPDDIFIRPPSLKAQEIDIFAGGDTLRSFASQSRVSKSSQKKAKRSAHKLAIIDDHVGLPHGHHLLKGYNLEDTRQEVHIKTARYHFDEGSLQLYEERWCFTDMNRTLDFVLNGNRIFLKGVMHGNIPVSRNIRILTPSDIAVRMMGTEEECSKVVINYPNGLSIYYQETHVEQIWQMKDSCNDEERRIYTPYGAVIVFYNTAETILVMRYNGEVYQLHQFEMDEGEEEQIPEMTVETSSEKPGKAPRGSRGTGKKGTTRKSRKTNTAKSRLGKIPEHEVLTTGENKNQYRTMYAEMMEGEGHTHKTLAERLRDSVSNELRYLDMLISEYGLGYLHLRVTTSEGRVVNLTHRGKVYNEHPVNNHEWHDYFANESYAMRADGVKMIWTKDVLKCYHADGTVITTKTEEGYESADFLDFEMSSSHLGEMEEEGNHDMSDIKLETQSSLQFVSIPLKKATKNKPSSDEWLQVLKEIGELSLASSGLLYEQLEEEGELEDTGYVTYESESFIMQHKCYATISAIQIRTLANNLRVFVEIYALDDMQVQVYKGEIFDQELVTAMETKGEPFTDGLKMARKFSSTNTKVHSVGRNDEHKSDDQDLGVDDSRASTIVKLWIGSGLDLLLTEKSCEVKAAMKKYIEDSEETSSETMEYSFDFETGISDVFFDFVAQIASFKNYQKSQFDDLYFLERITPTCSYQGFEFLSELPELSKYNFSISNTVTEFKHLKTVNEKMTNIFDWYDEDMTKFPRFPVRVKKVDDPIKNFPLVLSSNLYLKIPTALSNTKEIHKFVNTFDNIGFKKTRPQIKEALEYFLHPSLQDKLKLLLSQINWKQRLEEHKRRMLVEEQRKGLYQAMLKHKAYPRYFQMKEDFRGHVKYIDFFNFVGYKCMKCDPPLETIKKTIKLQDPPLETIRKPSTNFQDPPIEIISEPVIPEDPDPPLEIIGEPNQLQDPPLEIISEPNTQ